jgi:hypothetical protein
MNEPIKTGDRCEVIAGALGAAACVLGWFVLQRHKQARLALSVVAVPLFFSGFASGSIAASFVAVSAMLLWSGPARDWFAGRPVRQPPMLVAPVQRPPTAPPAPPAGPPVGPPTGPPAVPPEAGDRVDAPHLPPVPTGVASTAPPPYAGFGAPRPASAYAPPARPRALVSALVITWVTSALVAAVTCMFLLAMLAEPDLFRQMVARDPQLTELGLSLAELRSLAVATSLVCLGWALVAAFLALLVMMRVTWARPALIASAVISGLISCFAFAAVAPLVTAVAGMVTAYLLLRPEVAQWVNRR